MVLGELQLQSWQSLQYHSQMHAWDAWSSTWYSQHLLELGQPRNLPGDPRSLSLSPFLGFYGFRQAVCPLRELLKSCALSFPRETWIQHDFFCSAFDSPRHSSASRVLGTG